MLIVILDTDAVLGSGNFGIVYKGTVLRAMETVAFKTIRQGNASSLRGMLAEIKIMSYVGRHENVVGFFGAYTAEITHGKQSLINVMIGL
jgi:serine/threonine protein kinase